MADPPEILAADAEALDEGLVARLVIGLQELQQAHPAAHHLEETVTRREIFLVHLEMIGQVVDLLGQKRDLDLGGAGVAFVSLKFLDYVLFVNARQR
mgnify:CR=1 FL=1